MPYTHSNQERECLWCEAPIEGRADKQFCNSACKARYNRENFKEQVEEPLLKPISTKISADDREEIEEDWEDHFERTEKERRSQELIDKLHKTHTKLISRFLQKEDSIFDSESIDDFLDDLDDAASEYRQHPGLRKAGHPAHNRLADLYLVRDNLRELRKEVQDLEGNNKSFFGKSEPELVYLEISKKHRKRLRTNLLGEQ